MELAEARDSMIGSTDDAPPTSVGSADPIMLIWDAIEDGMEPSTCALLTGFATELASDSRDETAGCSLG